MRATTDPFPQQPHDPPLAAEALRAGLRRSRTPARKSPRSLVWEPPPRAEGGGERERQSPRHLPGPVLLAKPCWSRPPSPFPAWQNHSPGRSTPGAQEGLWQVEVGFPGKGLWERKGSGATLTWVSVPTLPLGAPVTNTVTVRAPLTSACDVPDAVLSVAR